MNEQVNLFKQDLKNAKISAGVGFILGYQWTTLNFLHVSSLILNPMEEGSF